MDRPRQESIDAFVSVTGVSEDIAVQKLQEHGGDLNSALNAYFAGSYSINLLEANGRASGQGIWEFGGTGVSDLHNDTNNRRFIVGTGQHRPPSSQETVGSNLHHGRIIHRTPMSPSQQPSVSQPRELRETPTEVQGSNVASSSPADAIVSTTADVTRTENDRGPKTGGIVKVNYNDLLTKDPKILKRAIADFHNESSSWRSGIVYSLVPTGDTIARSLCKHQTNSSSSCYTEHPREVVGQKRKATHPSMPQRSGSTSRQDEESNRQSSTKEAPLPLDPFADENNVVSIVLRMPDGRWRSRRFLKSDTLKVLLDYIVGGGVQHGKYKLIRCNLQPAFPLGDEYGALTLNEIGLESKETLIVVRL